MDIFIFKNCQPENHDDFIMALEKAFGDKKPMSAAERARKYREKKKASQNVTEDSVMGCDENVTKEKEEEEREEERVSPLDSPSSLPSSPSDSPINYPITPFNPPLPKEEEREEGEKESAHFSADAESESETVSRKRNRGKLCKYGTAADVMLSKEEFHKLEEKIGYPNVIDLIDELSYYMAENPKNAKKYTDHYYTLLNWDRRRRKEQISRNNYSPPQDDFLDGIEWEGMNE